jgi:hypothetical protein
MESTINSSDPILTAAASRQISQHRSELVGSAEFADTDIAADSAPIPEENSVRTSTPLLDEVSIVQLRAFFDLLDRWEREAHATTIP